MKKVRKTPTGQETSIVNGTLYFEDCRQCEVDQDVFKDIIGDGYTRSIRVISLDMTYVRNVWVTMDTKHRETINVQMTLRREIRSGRGHWYAYRRVFGKLHKRYVGTDDQITQNRILEIAEKLPSV